MISADSPDAVTIADREQTGIALMFGCPVVVLAAAGLANAPAWIRHGDTALVVVYASAVMIALVWVCARAWRMQVRIDEYGVTARNFFRTYRIGWPEIRRFEDGSRWAGQAGHIWALRIVRREGRAVISTMASLGGWRAARRRAMLVAAVRQAAAGYGIPAELTGNLPRRESRPTGSLGR
jgi:Bacterial PH domain